MGAKSAGSTGGAIRVARLGRGEPREVLIAPDAGARAALAEELGISAVRKLRFAGRLTPSGKRDWLFEAHLGATVVQPCVVSLAPVTTRIEEEVRRLYVADLAPPEGDEVEVPEDVDEEPLGEAIDPEAVMREALALALPPWPRAEGAELGEAAFDEPEAAEDEKPFAGLAALKGRLDSDE